MTKIQKFLAEYLGVFFRNLDFALVFIYLFGLAISSFILFRKANNKLVHLDVEGNDALVRIKRKIFDDFKPLSLLNEYKAGVFLLAALNLLLLILNIIDIKWVWFGFEWSGQYLKQFVHEGTYLLIVSILISIALVLYYFRGNLNFYQKNATLKYLSYAWLAQNAILVISVAIRNFRYIDHFALAYKRIGVIVFLVLTFYGLYTVFIKVRDRKSSFYLFRMNAYSVLFVLMLTSILNWDSIITRYNFSHANHSFLHLDYLVTMSDKTLPYLDHDLADLEKVDSLQKKKFDFEQEYMTPQEYHSIIQQRKKDFTLRWDTTGVLSWNLPEHLAYQKLMVPK